MPLRAKPKDVGTSLGKMIFHGKGEKGIVRSLKGADQHKLTQALERRGLGHLSHEKIAEVLSGKDRAGLRHGQLTGVVEALQSSGIASAKRTASQMVLQASREAQLKANPGLTPEAMKRRLKRFAIEQRAEANAEPSRDESVMGILDRMRSEAGRANKRTEISEQKAESSDQTSNGQRLTSKSGRLELQPKIKVPKPGEETGAGFQA